MRIDIITIFPEFFSVLDVSLVGKARQSGLIDLRVHNLRDHTHDRHHSVDDTPYGGGAGMVMKPEPWGDAIDAILTDVHLGAEPSDASVMPETTATDASPLLIFPSPAGDLFTQAMARELAEESNLIFGCGRYEGIDQRVFDHFEQDGRVRLVSLGDYVLNGGEVAVMAIIEAVGRLIPGVVGNPESLVEESHEDGLLEYPSYTKPAAWRGLDVPSVLLSGNHGAVAAWRREQQFLRTARVRPDLLPPAN
ncbi:tRNA (guanosine(37)-N1)-methyltransferase TrmD [Cryobacterium sp. TMT1-19]|uniref:tRNA (guanosine(37)-N1)-methyltransferase TrmD n=1 Tax=Cryobacterium sp. TMT1-19 TaxID=1259231 RepID=UPI00106DA5E2|nr:tRNA (guanosine(37)-N1)-methyltransferase TrmD [Cryobacterium sp. TMT1-19]TFD31045.1 tRNA (guanosine(37)-N1)-methyltransferase TrmD [Cryobacterium sp. TMT1-19]